MWQRLRLALCCSLLAALTGVAVQAYLLLCAATRATAALPAAVSAEIGLTRTALVAQVAGARADLTAQVAAARRDVLVRTERQVAAVRTDVMDQVAQIRVTADRRIGDSLARVDTAMEKIEEVRGDVKPVLDHAGSVAKQVDDAAPLFLDCEYNPDCAFNRFQGTSKAIEQMAQAGAKAAPEITASVAGIASSGNAIAADAKREADEIAKPKTPVEKALGPIYTLARIIGIFW